jgi:hypothetical protein
VRPSCGTVRGVDRIAGLVVIVPLLLLAPDVRAELTFGSLFQEMATGDPATSHPAVTVADFNGDSRPDLALSGGAAGGVRLLFGRGDGTFAEPVVIPVSGPTGALVAGDVSGDGITDLVVVRTAPTRIVVLHGRGDGAFEAGAELQHLSGPMEVVLGDVNADGITDIALHAVPYGQMVVHRGGGDLSYPRIGLVQGPTGCRSPLLVDVNEDGSLDYIVAEDSPPSIIHWLGAGDGTFGWRRDVALSVQPTALALADATGDGRLDLIVGGVQDLHLLPGVGPDRLGPPQSMAFPFSSTAIHAGDFNGDGIVDLAVGTDVNGTHGTIRMLRGVGDGGFQLEREEPSGRGFRALDAADLDADGRLDLVVCPGTANVNVFFGRGDFRFGDLLRHSLERVPAGLVAADLNADRRADLIAWQSDVPSLDLYWSGEDGRPSPVEVLDLGFGPTRVVPRDMDRDGHVDLLVAGLFPGSGAGGVVALLRGLGEGRFREERRIRVEVRPAGVVVLDHDGDGALDVVVYGGVGLSTGQETLLLLRGNGRGELTQIDRRRTPADFGASATADLDGDGRDDLIVGNADWVRVYYGSSSGLVDEQLLLDEGVSSLAVVEVDGDGRPDLMIRANGFRWHRNQGDRVFAPGQSIGFPSGSSSQGFVDLDDDGHADIVSATEYQGVVTVARGLGDGRFGTPRIFGTVRQPGRLLAVDMDGDGARDLIGLHGGGASFFLMRNLTTRTAPSPGDPPAASTPGVLNLVGVTPNPMQSVALLDFEVSAPGDVVARIHDVRGRLVATRRIEAEAAGRRSIAWDARDQGGRAVPDGVYFIRLTSEGRTASGKVVVAR